MSVQCTPGRYAATITGHKLTTSKAGNLMIAFTCNVAGKVDPASGEPGPEGAGMTRTVLRAITDQTADRVWKELDALGYPGDGFDSLDPELAEKNGVPFHDLTGTEVFLRCAPDSYQGEPREKWEFDLLGGGLNLDPADAAKAREANALYGRKGPKPAAAAAKPAGQRANGTVPF